MTAAHCVKSLFPEELTVRVGDWDASADIEVADRGGIDKSADIEVAGRGVLINQLI